MVNEKLSRWADLLLDTGKKNNLINFKDSKASTVEVLCPDFGYLFSKVDHSAIFEVYDPKDFLEDEEDDFSHPLQSKRKIIYGDIGKGEYKTLYSPKLRKSNHILIYNKYVNPITALKNIGKKAKSALEETGVNIAYFAFGFVKWSDNTEGKAAMKAPILLAPISIENPSAIDPYYIRVLSDEVIVNPTFSFKLLSEYGIKFPEYEDEPVDEYLEKVLALVSKLGWGVERECKIGIFSFQKINMHRDLKDNADLIMQNEQVKILLGEITPTESSKDGTIILPRDIFDIHNVVDADSSQTEAILMAKSGRSFVLQGPPGTGKSQTITNVIAECLAEGKKVLFVSEKLAALNVVYEKLKAVGLEEFCLELHSHKANKKDFIDELCETLKTPKSGLSERAHREIDEKFRAERDLDDYVIELHSIRPTINRSLYSLIEEYYAYSKIPEIKYPIENISEKTEDYLLECVSLLTRYQGIIEQVGEDYRKNPWYGYDSEDSSFHSIEKVKVDLAQTITYFNEIIEIKEEILTNFGIDLTNYQKASDYLKVFGALKDFKYVTPQLINEDTLQRVKRTAEELKALAQEIFEKQNIINQDFYESIYSLDGGEYFYKLTHDYTSFVKRLFSKEFRTMSNEIRFARKDGKKCKYEEMIEISRKLDYLHGKKQEFSQKEDSVKSLFSSYFGGLNTNFDELLSELTKLKEILSLKLSFGNITSATNEQFVAHKYKFAEIHLKLSNIYLEKREIVERFASSFDKAIFDILGGGFYLVRQRLLECKSMTEQIEVMPQFNRLLCAIKEKGLIGYIHFVIDNFVKAEYIVSGYKKDFYMQWIDFIIHSSPILMRLSRHTHDETVSVFKQKDQHLLDVNRAIIKSQLSASRPRLDMVVHGSAVSTLLREGEKKRKQKSIRRLLEEIQELIQGLKPCFLMSPLSVSTFLSPNVKFDVVVFDEASQIFPQDAIGAIYRAKQAIIVGDSKQMPPSNFFNAMSVDGEDEDEEDDISDFESILDLCSTAFPQKRLKWHYRSRHEQLIAFSNKHFYENELITFPSSQKDKVGIGLDYYHVDGIFDRKTKTNRVEAEKVVELVFKHIEEYPDRSLGVVAFSISQQNLIDKLISRKRASDPTREWFFKGDKEEPFFVKNLETVQGDERDTIIFSVAYARGDDGKLLFNFGPINRQGGERRLNVAATRAKHNVQLVSSMRHTDIDLNRTKSVGSMILRDYIAYAEQGKDSSSSLAIINPFEHLDRNFENEVYEFITSKGFAVDVRVGKSAYKIDFAVKHPQGSKYVLAIECDGPTYSSAKSTCDRDRLRQEVLERMGWNFYRIWSTDWMRYRFTEQAKLLDAIENAMAGAPKVLEEPHSELEIYDEVIEEVGFEFPIYHVENCEEIATLHNFNKANTIVEIVKREGPISEEWLLKRICFLFGKDWVTSKVKEEYESLIPLLKANGVEFRRGFLSMEGRPIPMLRIAEEDETNKREIKYIPLGEIANGFKKIIQENVMVVREELFRLVAHKLGYRMSDAIAERFEQALGYLSTDIIISGENISLKA